MPYKLNPFTGKLDITGGDIQASGDFELNSVFTGTIYEHVRAATGPNNPGEFVEAASSPSNFHFKLSGTDNNGATITAPTSNGSMWVSADGTTYAEVQLGSVSSESYGWRVNFADLDEKAIYKSLTTPSGYPIESGDTLYWANSDPAGTPVALADGDVVQYNAADGKFKPAQISSGTTLPTAQDGQALIQENGQWVAGPVIGGVDYFTGAGDQYINNVALLMNFEGTDGSTVFTDSSPNNLTLTPDNAGSNLKISTTQFKYGSSSGYFFQRRITASSNIPLNSDPFTVEAWIYRVEGQSYSSSTGWTYGPMPGDIFSTRGTGDGITFGIGSSGELVFFRGNVLTPVISTTTTIGLGVWTHVAVTRDSNDVVTLWIDGVSSATQIYQDTNNVGYNLGTGSTPTIGRRANSNVNHYFGYIDDLRVTPGVCRYTADFTPPTTQLSSQLPTQTTIPYSIDKLDDVDTSTVAPTDGQALLWDNTAQKWEPGTVSGGISLPFAQDGEALIYENGQWVAGPVIGGVNYTSGDPYSANVSLAMDLEGGLVDISSNSLTVSGSGTASTTQAKYGTQSLSLVSQRTDIIYDDATQGHLFDFTTAFTFECWVYPQLGGTSGGYALFSNWGTVGVNHNYIQLDPSGQTVSLIHGATTYTSTGAWTYNNWHHIAVTWDGSTLRFFIDGVLDASSYSVSTPFDFRQGGRVTIGNTVSINRGYRGYIDDLRVTKNVARYTATFAPPGTITPTTYNIPYSIDNLDDVDTSTVAPTDGQALLWDNTAQKWEPGTVSGGGGTTLPSANDGEALIYENGSWVAGPVIGGVDYTSSSGDSNFSYVELLALFNGTDGTQAFTDSSSVGHTLTPTGNSSTVKISTAESKFGGASAFFNSGYISLSSRIEFQSDPFTVEAWIYPTVADQGAVFSNRDSSNGMELIRLSNGTIMFHHGNVANSIITTTTTSLNTWSHIAVTRDSNDLFTVWINGVDSGNDTFAGVSLGAGHANPKIARQASSSAQYYRGYIDDLRVTNGVCRYTADFTAPTAELPSSAPPQITIPYSIDKLDDVDTSTVAPTDGTTLIYENGTYIPGPVIGGVNYNSGDSDFSSVAALFHFNGTNGSTTFTDSGPDGLSMTASGSASISTAQSKFGGASGSFPGGSHITFPATIPFNSDPFTVECWVYPTTLDGNNIYSARTSGSGITFRLLSNGELNFFYGHGTSAFQTTAGVPLNTWSHVAVTRDSNNLFTLWIDGVSSATSTITASMGTGATPVIGKAASFGGEYFKGYIDELRVTKGVCRYTANFTPPTAELADISSQVTITAADSIRTLLGIDEYADDTAAGTGGLSSGELYYNTTSSSYVLKT